MEREREREREIIAAVLTFLRNQVKHYNVSEIVQ